MARLLIVIFIVLIIYMIYKIAIKGKFKAKYRTEDLDIFLPDKKDIKENDLCLCELVKNLKTVVKEIALKK